MREITIAANDAGRRLDRFLRKYLSEAPLGEIYKFIRKDVKVDGKRRSESYILSEGEVLSLYLPDEQLISLSGGRFVPDGEDGSNGTGIKVQAAASGEAGLPKRTFGIIYEDENILIADKPRGLLTHGSAYEKKNHLANQVVDYLIAKGDFDPRSERVFTPAPANRLDRNTTGIVLFGKTAEAMRELGRAIRDNDIGKFYITIVCGRMDERVELSGMLTKDEDQNKVSITQDDSVGARSVITVVSPLEHLKYSSSESSEDATLAEVELVTGRPHQIRAHLASIRHPVIGDLKYAGPESDSLNEYINSRLHLKTQLLHAARVEFRNMGASLEYLSGQSFAANMPDIFRRVLELAERTM